MMAGIIMFRLSVMVARKFFLELDQLVGRARIKQISTQVEFVLICIRLAQRFKIATFSRRRIYKTLGHACKIISDTSVLLLILNSILRWCFQRVS